MMNAIKIICLLGLLIVAACENSPKPQDGLNAHAKRSMMKNGEVQI
jgi:hypothetical protein